LGVETARLLGDTKIQFITLRDISGVLGQQGHYEQAELSIETALKIAKQENQIAWQCKALVSLSGLKRRQRLFEVALDYCQSAIDLTNHLPTNQRGEVWASIQYELGKIARDREDWHGAEKHFVAARDVFGFRHGSAEFDVGRAWGVLGNLGVVSHKLGVSIRPKRSTCSASTFVEKQVARGPSQLC